MTTTGFSGAVRTGAAIVVLAAAAALGLVVGNAIADGQGAHGPAADALPGAAITTQSRTATAAFSLDAVRALAAIRDESSAGDAGEYADYGLRHAAPAQAGGANHELRKRAPKSSTENGTPQQLAPAPR